MRPERPPRDDALNSPRGSAMPRPEATPTAATACASARGWRTAVLASSASRVPIHRLSVKAKEERVRTPPGSLPVIVKGHRRGTAEGGTPRGREKGMLARSVGGPTDQWRWRWRTKRRPEMVRPKDAERPLALGRHLFTAAGVEGACSKGCAVFGPRVTGTPRR